MNRRYYRKPYRMFEDDNEENSPGENNQEDSKQELIALNQKVASLVNQKNQIKMEMNTRMSNIDKQIILLMDQIAKLGGTVNPNNIKESYRRKSFSSKLYESTNPSTNTSEMKDVIITTFDNANISYIPTDTECNTHARNVISFINKTDFRRMDADEKEESLMDYVRERLERSNYSFSRNEIERFIKEFKDTLERNSMFQWIFE